MDFWLLRPSPSHRVAQGCHSADGRVDDGRSDGWTDALISRVTDDLMELFCTQVSQGRGFLMGEIKYLWPVVPWAILLPQ